MMMILLGTVMMTMRGANKGCDDDDLIEMMMMAVKGVMTKSVVKITMAMKVMLV